MYTLYDLFDKVSNPLSAICNNDDYNRSTRLLAATTLRYSRQKYYWYPPNMKLFLVTLSKCSFRLFKAMAKSNRNLFAIAFKSYRNWDSWKRIDFRESHKKRSKELIPKRKQRRYNNDKAKSLYWKRIFGYHHNYFAFWKSPIIYSSRVS